MPTWAMNCPSQSGETDQQGLAYTPTTVFALILMSRTINSSQSCVLEVPINLLAYFGVCHSPGFHLLSDSAWKVEQNLVEIGIGQGFAGRIQHCVMKVCHARFKVMCLIISRSKIC